MEISIRELKNQLSKYLRKVAAGDEVVITSHNRPVARLTRVQAVSEEKPTRQELLRRLKTMPGVYIAKGGKPKGARRPIRIRPGEKTLADIVLEERR